MLILRGMAGRAALFFLLVGSPVSLLAQTSGTCGVAVDSIAHAENHKPFLKSKDIIGIAVPVVMITYGIISIESDGLKGLDYSTRNELLEDNTTWNNKWDNYLQFSPAALAFGLKLGGMESTHRLSDMVILYTLSNILVTGVVYTTKHLTGRERPNGSDYHSFPSGHTATAFVAAEFLHQEYKDQSIWISVGGYGMATLIGVSRVYNNKHWISDVVAGAGIGILSTKIIYMIYPSLQNLFTKKNKNHQTLIGPTYNDGVLGLNFSYTF